MIWIKRVTFFSLILCSFILVVNFVTHVPYFYISIELFLILVFIAIRSRRSSNWKVFLINLAAIFLAIGFAEAFCAGWDGFGFSPGIEEDRELFVQGGDAKECGKLIDEWKFVDNVRGYALPKNARINARKSFGDTVIYDVTYTSNKDGLRVSPHDLSYLSNITQNDSKNLIFFGCSCTLGEGVNDNETYPYLIEDKSRGQYRSYNFAMEGYGPHQMLRILETGLLDSIIPENKPAAFFYLALTAHMYRSSCKYPYFTWDVNGPRYELNSFKEVIYAGKFNDNLISKIKFNIYGQLTKSHLILGSFWIKQLIGWNVSQQDRELFIAIILKSIKLISQKYKVPFYVIVWANDIWSDDSEDYEYIISELKKYQVNLIETKDIFAKYESPKDKDSYLIKYDGHPNKLAYDRVAEYILKYIDSDLSK